jgi:hypothetical protein
MFKGCRAQQPSYTHEKDQLTPRRVNRRSSKPPRHLLRDEVEPARSPSSGNACRHHSWAIWARHMQQELTDAADRQPAAAIQVRRRSFFSHPGAQTGGREFFPSQPGTGNASTYTPAAHPSLESLRSPVSYFVYFALRVHPYMRAYFLYSPYNFYRYHYCPPPPPQCRKCQYVQCQLLTAFERADDWRLDGAATWSADSGLERAPEPRRRRLSGGPRRRGRPLRSEPRDDARALSREHRSQMRATETATHHCDCDCGKLWGLRGHVHR